jgi:calcineurin-like phosphoesterase family protein
VIWLLPDTHLGHDKIKEYCHRPDDYIDQIHSGLSVVKENDVLYHLGDVAMYWSVDRVRDFFSCVKGRKFLIRGNHDRGWSDRKWLTVFDGVFDGVILKGTLLVHRKPGSGFGLPIIHGHGHRTVYSDYGVQLGLEDNNYKPFNFDNFKE